MAKTSGTASVGLRACMSVAVHLFSDVLEHISFVHALAVFPRFSLTS